MSVADSARTTSKSVYVIEGTAITVPSIESSLTKSPSACTTIDKLVEVYDDDSLMNWTSLQTNSLYAALLTDGTTTQLNTDPEIKLKPSSSYFTLAKGVVTKQVRVTYTVKYSQQTNGSNRVVDQFAVTIYPTPYVRACETVSLSQTNIADFTLLVKHAAGTAASDKTFSVTNAAVTGCTNGITWTLEFIDPADGFITNPHGTYISMASSTGVLTYQPPPASFMNG